MNFMNKFLSVVVVLSLLLCNPMLAQTAPSGPCNVLPNGNSVIYTVGSIQYFCPTGVANPQWTQLPSLASTENKIVSTNLNAMRMAHATYSFAVDGGAIGAITPVTNFTLPANAVITNVALNSTTAVTSLGSATVSVGTTAGSSAASLVAATAKATWSANAFVQGVPVPQTASTFIKLTAAGQASVTVAVAALTAGVIEIYVWYYVSAS